MDSSTRVGIVGGNGWIGGALARAAGRVRPAAAATSPSPAAAPRPTGFPARSGPTTTRRSPTPPTSSSSRSARRTGPPITLSAPGKLVVSVMAGIPLADLAARTGTARVVRALPNAAAEVGHSYTPWTASPAVTDADRATVRRISRPAAPATRCRARPTSTI